MRNPTFYVIAYDVVGDRRRQKLSKLLEGYGLRVQKSVFECVLTDWQYEFVHKRVQALIKESEDQVRFYALTAHTRRKTVILGVQSPFAVDDTAFIV